MASHPDRSQISGLVDVYKMSLIVGCSPMPKRHSKNPKSDPESRGRRVKQGKLKKLLNTDIKDLEIADSLKRLGNIQVMDWDFKRTPKVKKSSATSDTHALGERLKNFLQYVSENLIDEPSQSQISISEVSPDVLHLRLILVKRDLSMLVGRGGGTAEAIRGIIKAAGKQNGVSVLLQMISHEDAANPTRSVHKK